MRMQAVRDVSKETNLNRALQYYKVPKHALVLHRKTKKRSDKCRGRLQGRKDILQAARVRKTGRMAAQVARETGIPANRKKIQRICRKIGWNGPPKRQKRDKSCIKTQKVQT